MARPQRLFLLELGEVELKLVCLLSSLYCLLGCFSAPLFAFHEGKPL